MKYKKCCLNKFVVKVFEVLFNILVWQINISLYFADKITHFCSLVKYRFMKVANSYAKILQLT